MERKVIIDTDFLSSFFKIKKIELICKALDSKELIVTRSVLNELQKAAFYNEFLEYLNSSKNKITVKDVGRSINEECFGEGELDSISLAKITDSLLLMSDSSAKRLAESEGVTVIDLPQFLADCKERKIISREEVREIIKDLKEKDDYEFSYEVKEKLEA